MTIIEKGVYESSLYPSPELHMVYYSKELYDINASKMVHEFDYAFNCTISP